MARFSVRGCVRHTNVSAEILAEWDKLDSATRSLDGQMHVLCRVYTLEVEDRRAAFTKASSLIVADAFDAGLFGPADVPHITVVQI